MIQDTGPATPVTVAEVAKSLGVNPKIAYVRGDDLLPRMNELIAADQLSHFETDEPIKDARLVEMAGTLRKLQGRGVIALAAADAHFTKLPDKTGVREKSLCATSAVPQTLSPPRAATAGRLVTQPV